MILHSTINLRLMLNDRLHRREWLEAVRTELLLLLLLPERRVYHCLSGRRKGENTIRFGWEELFGRVVGPEVLGDLGAIAGMEEEFWGCWPSAAPHVEGCGRTGVAS